MNPPAKAQHHIDDELFDTPAISPPGVEVDIVKVDRPTSGLHLYVPVGRIKVSSSNSFREQGHAATDFHTREKTIYNGVE